ncbi:MAG: type IV toxin-antitoxin system AbiEi family antitoxin [Dehalococcoidia bacterium]
MSDTMNYAHVNGLRLLEAAIQQFGPVFGIDQLEDLADRTLPRSRLRWTVSALIRSGRLEPLKRGMYVLKNPPPGVEVHPFAVAAALIQSSVISHWSALAHHGFTTQVPRMVQISVPRKIVTPEMRQGKAYRPRGRVVWKAAGVEVEIIHIQPRAFFGHQKIWVSSWNQVAITDAERTALDLVARPEVFGGLPAALGILEEILPRLNLPKLVGYGVDYQVGAVIKRLGWCLEQLGVEQNLLSPLQQVPVRNKTLLDPRTPASAILNERWQVVENLRSK